MSVFMFYIVQDRFKLMYIEKEGKFHLILQRILTVGLLKMRK